MARTDETGPTLRGRRHGAGWNDSRSYATIFRMLASATMLPTLPRPYDRVDRYQVLAEIAHGGMAAVYAVRRVTGGKLGKRLSEVENRLDKVLAMKVLLPHLAKDERFVDMFLDEARIAAQIMHPNVVQLFEVGSDHHRPFMVMEFLRGQSLSQVIRTSTERPDQALPDSLLLRICADVARGLHAAHEVRDFSGEALNVVHRDVSPQNVHVGYDGQVKVVDFGIAAASGRITSTKTGEVKGKLSYMAPEQLHKREPTDRRTDVWALGVMLWQALAGEKLFRGDTDADTLFNVLNRDIPDIQSKNPDVPDGVAACVMATLEREPQNRPKTALEVAKILSEEADRLGGDRAKLVQYMEKNYIAERATEKERLASALREGPAPPLRTEEASSGQVRVLGVSDESETQVVKVPTKSPLRLLVPALILIAGGAVALFVFPDLSSGETGAITQETPLAPVANPDPENINPIAAANEPAPGPEIIELQIGSRVRLVLVNGELHRERPVSFALSDGESADVVLVGPDGEETHQVTVADHGRELSLAAPEGRSRPDRPTMATPRPRMTAPTPMIPSMTGGNGLLEVEI